jgi:hypothetical protein
MGMDIFVAKALPISSSFEDAEALLGIAEGVLQEHLVTVGTRGMPAHITNKLIKLGYKKGDKVSVVEWHLNLCNWFAAHHL